jgi:MtN3 and saliva related transmembrane protein
VRALRTKSTGDLSFPMLVMMFSGATLWTLYGLLVEALPIIVPNTVLAVLTVALMVLRLTYD